MFGHWGVGPTCQWKMIRWTTPLEISLSWISWGSSISNEQEMTGLLYLWLLPKISSWDYCLVFVPDWLGLVDKLVLSYQSCLQVTAMRVPLVRKNVIIWLTHQEIFSLWNLLRISHLEWAGGGGVFISLSLTLTFPCGINEFISGLGSDLFWLVGPFLLPFLFPLSYVLLSTIDIYFIYSAAYLWDFPRVNKNRYKFYKSL
jgi:hypothetical protein